jgi:hypothetical protein
MKMDKQVKYGVIFSLQSAAFQLESGIFNIPLWNL